MLRHLSNPCVRDLTLGVGYAVTGGQDTVINIFALPSAKGEPNFSLLGHTDNVCALHTAEDGTIISGSWDK